MVTPQGGRPDAAAAICRDLEALRTARARHFSPAVLLGGSGLGLLAVILGLRPDLADLSPVQWIAQATTLGLGLVVFPAIGVGLWFPGPRVRIAVVVGAVLATTLGSLGVAPPCAAPPCAAPWSLGPCPWVLGGVATALAIGAALSGAFRVRRSSFATWWIAGGIALASLDVLLLTCGSDSGPHIAGAHLGAAAVVTAVVAWMANRWRRCPASVDAAGPPDAPP